MKLLLINPYAENFLFCHNKEYFLSTFLASQYSMTLVYLAALVPPDVEVGIRDEVHLDEIDYDMNVDLVGITSMTSTALRAYQIADEFRKRGVKVVLGGIHPTALPHEAITHADAVVIGEAEDVWEQLIRDFQKGKMKKFYRRDSYHDLKGLPFPRWDLIHDFNTRKYTRIQTSRGCPFNCEYCSVSVALGPKYRFRPVSEVLSEIEATENKYFAFTDDNIVGNTKYAKELLKKMIPYKKRWKAFVSTTVRKDKELLRLLEKSGCIAVNIGFESIEKDSLKDMGKYHNKVEYYSDVINKLHDHGILIMGNFIFGFDCDSKSIFERTIEFCIKSKIDVIFFFILTPYPSTPLYQRLKKEKRLLEENWWLNKANLDLGVFFQPKLMSIEELVNGYHYATNEVYEFSSILERTRKLGGKGSIGRLLTITSNLVMKKYYSNYLENFLKISN